MTPPERLEYAMVPTQIGTFRIVYQGSAVRLVDLLERGLTAAPLPEEAVQRRPPYAAASPPRQLMEYFQHRRGAFEVDAQPGTLSTFDRAVYRELLKVPAGKTITYGKLARKAGHSGAARAVGGAMHRNPIPIVIPCHRVVGESGSLQGFGLGLWRKRWLLDFEGAWPLKSKTPEGPRDPHQRTFETGVDDLEEIHLERTSGRRPAARPEALTAPVPPSP